MLEADGDTLSVEATGKWIACRVLGTVSGANGLDVVRSTEKIAGTNLIFADHFPFGQVNLTYLHWPSRIFTLFERRHCPGPSVV